MRERVNMNKLALQSKFLTLSLTQCQIGIASSLIASMLVSGCCTQSPRATNSNQDDRYVEFSLSGSSSFFSHDREYPVLVQRNNSSGESKAFPSCLFQNTNNLQNCQHAVREVAKAFNAQCWMNDKFAVLGYNLHEGQVVLNKGIAIHDVPEFGIQIYSTNCDGARLADVVSFLDDCLTKQMGENHRSIICDNRSSDILVSFYPDASLCFEDWLFLLVAVCPINVNVNQESVQLLYDNIRSPRTNFGVNIQNETVGNHD